MRSKILETNAATAHRVQSRTAKANPISSTYETMRFRMIPPHVIHMICGRAVLADGDAVDAQMASDFDREAGLDGKVEGIPLV